MSMKQTSKKELIVIKSVEPRGWGDISPCLSGGIPPLGTINDTGVPTSEDIPGDDATPIRGAFEVLIGKTAVSFKLEPDKSDSQDVDGTPKSYNRGHDTYSGQFEFDQLKNSQRIQGAVDGHWDPDDLVYTPYMDFRAFEVWTLVNPQDANGNCAMSLDAVKCDTLMKHYEVIFDSLDESRDIPNKLTVPISRRLYQRFKNFTFPTSAVAFFTGAALAAGTYTKTTTPAVADPREHTRIRMNVTVGTTGTVTVYGANIFGEPVSEVLNIADKDANGNVIGHVYFTTVTTVVTSIGSLSFTLNDFDYGLRNPA